MTQSELLHRLFDEGLSEPLEHALFARMATDPELRRQFAEHLKLHSMIQEDVGSITTPAHVTEELFRNLGLTPEPTAVAGTSGQWSTRVRNTAAAGLLLLQRYRTYIATAVVSAAVTALILVATGDRDVREDDASRRGAAPAIIDDDNAATSAVDQRAATNTMRSEAVRSARAASLPAITGSARATIPVAAIVPPARSGEAAWTLDAEAHQPPTPAMASMTRTDALVVHPATLGMAESRSSSMESAAANVLARPVTVMEAPPADAAPLSGIHSFFIPAPRTSLLTNLVVELRKLYGQSFPDVNVQHNSHKVFENMAISTVYKVTEHHAVGVEYGRENFGQEYLRTRQTPTVRLADLSIMDVTPVPREMTVLLTRDNRMLDVVGAVWKLSLPEYGMFGMVYPFMRTFVGATKVGPLGKVRVGLEMFPSNNSMLNVGVEGGMLRYSVENAAYYTSKLNLTFGVAVGF